MKDKEKQMNKKGLLVIFIVVLTGILLSGCQMEKEEYWAGKAYQPKSELGKESTELMSKGISSVTIQNVVTGLEVEVGEDELSVLNGSFQFPKFNLRDLGENL